MDNHSLMLNAVIYLAAALITVPLAKRLGLGSVLGYLIAGIAIGPAGLGMIDNVEQILHFAEFGVVLLLFLIGLELEPKRLWAMRRSILGMGGVQVVATSALLFGVGLALGLGPQAALVVAMGLSLSSTAIALQSLTEKNLLASHAGRSGFSILLFQDIAVIPMLALIPLLGGAAATPGDGSIMQGVLKAAGVIAAIVVLGHYLTRPVFDYIAKTRMREIFTAFALLLVIGIALLMQLMEMSMALGAFLAGVLLADSEYRHELEVEIEPFKGLLLGLFFIAVGMSVDFDVLQEYPLLIPLLTLGLVAVKAGLLWLIGGLPHSRISAGQRSLFSFVLSQGGEFAFVLFALAQGNGILETETANLLVMVVTLSMVTTPLLLLFHERRIVPRCMRRRPERAPDPVEERHNPVIIAGFGRFGRIVGRLLHAHRIPTTILDHDPDQIELVRQFGYKVYYGTTTRPEVLEAAGAGEARLLIVSIDDPQVTLQTVEVARKHFPHLQILARAHDMPHAAELLKHGVDAFERVTVESGLRLGEQALRRLGFGAYRAKQAANAFRDHDEALFRALHATDEPEKRITIHRQAREEIERILAADAQEYDLDDGRDWE